MHLDRRQQGESAGALHNDVVDDRGRGEGRRGVHVRCDLRAPSLHQHQHQQQQNSAPLFPQSSARLASAQPPFSTTLFYNPTHKLHATCCIQALRRPPYYSVYAIAYETKRSKS